jgi:hypothetical protein
MTIYEELLLRTEQGEKFHIDFEKRNMKVGKDWLIKNGEWEEGRELGADWMDRDSDMSYVEMLYHYYKHSTPSERSDSKRRTYFKALPVEQLTDYQLVHGEMRERAQAELEGYILINIIQENLKWKEEWGAWFWQSPNDKDLVILKSWIERKNVEE